MAQRDNGLARLAQAHIVGQNGTTASKKKSNPFDLVGEQSVCEFQSVLKRSFLDLRGGRSLNGARFHWEQFAPYDAAGQSLRVS